MTQNFFSAILVLTVCYSGAFAAEKKRPNILWIFQEDSNSWFSCYGETLIKTPHVDSLARDGILYKRGYVPSPVCSTSRSALMTGMMPTTIGAHNHRSSRTNSPYPEHLKASQIHLPKEHKLIPERIKEAGEYFTFMDDRCDFNFEYDLDQAFDSGSFYDALEQDKPWFGQIGLAKDLHKFLKKQVIQPEDVSVPPFYPDIPEFQKAMATHYNDLLGTDILVGKLLDTLREKGQLENTFIFFLSDHGTHRGLRHKQFVYEGGIHVPYLVRIPENYPVHERGVVVDDLVSSIDISVTTLELAGIKVPDLLEGRSLLKDDVEPRKYLVASRDRMDWSIDRVRCVTSKRFSYIRNFLPDRPYVYTDYRNRRQTFKEWRRLYEEGKCTPEAALFMAPVRPAEEFYDLVSDPHQVNNLIEDPKFEEAISQHRVWLAEWEEQTGDQGRFPESTEKLVHILYAWGNRCVSPEYEKVREKYPELVADWSRRLAQGPANKDFVNWKATYNERVGDQYYEDIDVPLEVKEVFESKSRRWFDIMHEKRGSNIWPKF